MQKRMDKVKVVPVVVLSLSLFKKTLLNLTKYYWTCLENMKVKL